MFVFVTVVLALVEDRKRALSFDDRTSSPFVFQRGFAECDERVRYDCATDASAGFRCSADELFTKQTNRFPLRRFVFLSSSTTDNMRLEHYQRSMDRTSEHLAHVQHDMDEIDRGFCGRLCCPSNSSGQKSKRKALPLDQKKSKDSRTIAAPDSIYSDARLKKLDSNLQQLQEFNRLMDKEIHSQLETLVR